MRRESVASVASSVLESLNGFSTLSRMASNSTNGDHEPTFPTFGRSASRVRLTAAFIKSTDSSRIQRDGLDDWTRMRLMVEDVLNSSIAELDLEFLNKIFERIDEDGSGELELEELIKGAELVPEFQSRLRVMDIDKSDLEQLFYMIDEDKGNSISPEEFKQALSRWLYDSKTAPRFAKYNTSLIMQEQQELKNMMISVSCRLDAMVPSDSRQSSKASSRQSKQRRSTKSKEQKNNTAPLQGGSGTESRGDTSSQGACSQDSTGSDEQAGSERGTPTAAPTGLTELNIEKATQKHGQPPSRGVAFRDDSSKNALKTFRKDLKKVVRQEQVLAARRHAEACIAQSVQEALNAVHEVSLAAIAKAFHHSIPSLRSTEADVGSNPSSSGASSGELGEALVAGRNTATPVNGTPETKGQEDEILVVV